MHISEKEVAGQTTVLSRIARELDKDILLKKTDERLSRHLLAEGLDATSLPVIAKPISTHGTGCTLAAAFAAELACGASLEKAVDGAKRFVHDAISSAYYVGRRCGVLGSPVRAR